MVKDFKAFILRGNVVELAIAVVFGAAFGAVVTSAVEDLLTPLISIPGTANFGELHFMVRDSVFAYGRFLNALIAFVLISGAVYFLVVVPANKLMARSKTEPEVVSTTRSCPECLSSIPMAASRCAFCTAVVTPVEPVEPVEPVAVAAEVAPEAPVSGLEGAEAEDPGSDGAQD